MVPNERNELVSIRPVTRWRVCMDYQKLNARTENDHFPMPFMDQMLDRLAGKGWHCFRDGYSGYNQISIPPEDQEKTTPSLALMGLSPSNGFPLGCAMLQRPSSVV